MFTSALKKLLRDFDSFNNFGLHIVGLLIQEWALLKKSTYATYIYNVLSTTL